MRLLEILYAILGELRRGEKKEIEMTNDSARVK